MHQKSTLKLTIEKCHFGVTQVEFLDRTITADSVAPQNHKVKTSISQTRKDLQKNIDFVKYYKSYISRLSEKLIGLYELIKADAKITISEELVETFEQINASIAEASGLALRQPVDGKQCVLMTDESSEYQDTMKGKSS